VKKTKRITLIILALGISIILSGCVSQSQPPSQTPPSHSEVKKVVLQEGRFNPEILYLKTGETVQWENNCCTGCTVTSDDGLFDSGAIKKGLSYNFTFNQPGIYLYHCEKIEAMSGRIIVE
jgi:plastocyanin